MAKVLYLVISIHVSVTRLVVLNMLIFFFFFSLDFCECRHVMLFSLSPTSDAFQQNASCQHLAVC